MKHMPYRSLRALVVLMVILFHSFQGYTQQDELFQDSVRVIRPKKRLSPIAIASYLRGDTYIKVTYGQPSKRNREIFGELVPYGQVWRTGANEATEITFTKDVRIGKQVLKAGTYTIFTLPQPNEWTIIFNRSVGLWGAYDYEKVKQNDVLQAKAYVEKLNEIYEAFTIKLSEQSNGEVNIEFIWDRTKASLPIQIIQ